MEINTLDGIGRPTMDAIPVLASDRIRTAPMVGARSQGGVGPDPVVGMWRCNLQQDPSSTYRFAHKFTTRQGPPTCSPPV